MEAVPNAIAEISLYGRGLPIVRKLYTNSPNVIWSGGQEGTSSELTSAFPFMPVFTGLPGSDGPSLISDMLGLLPSCALLPLC